MLTSEGSEYYKKLDLYYFEEKIIDPLCDVGNRGWSFRKRKKAP